MGKFYLGLAMIEHDFYNLTESKRLALVGSYFYEDGKKAIFFPLQLTLEEKNRNYGVRQGLIIVTQIRKIDGDNWFKIGVCSPDDLDMDLYFKNPQCNLRGEIIQYLKRINKTNVTYKEILTKVQKKFGGILT
jgi:hypothetical protein